MCPGKGMLYLAGQNLLIQKLVIKHSRSMKELKSTQIMDVAYRKVC